MLISLGIALLLSQKAHASETLLGAKALLEQLKPNVAKQGQPKIFENVKSEIESVKLRAPQLTPREGADAWLQLLHDWELATLVKADYESVWPDIDRTPKEILDALPSPEAWPLIRTALGKRPNDRKGLVLKMLFDALLNRDDEVLRNCSTLRKLRTGTDEANDSSYDGLAQIELSLAIRDRKADLFQELLAQAGSTGSFIFDQEVPDMIGLFGKARAEEMLRHVFRLAKKPLPSFKGSETLRLAMSTYMSDPKITSPQWTLALDSENPDFVEKMAARFPVPVDPSTSDFSQIQDFHAADLLAEGKIGAAKEFIKKPMAPLSGQLPDSLSTGQRAEQIWNGLSRMFDTDSSLGGWDVYVQLSYKLGKSSEALQRIDGVLGKPDLASALRHKLLVLKGDLIAREGNDKLALENYAKANELRSNDWSDETLPRIVGIAFATGNSSAFDLAVKGIGDSNTSSSGLRDFHSALVANGRFLDAEDLAIANSKSTGQSYGVSAHLAEIAEVYYLANRPQDVIDLIDSYCNWQADDLHEVLTSRPNYCCGDGANARPLGFSVAWAFSKTGNTDLAIKTLHDLIWQMPDFDDAYDLLSTLEGPTALRLYDTLAGIDRYNPRPVMWKADLLRRLGRLEEAETTARRALAIDPTDGLAPPGHRLMAMSILAKILRARGKEADATHFEQIVKAVRIAEEADRFRDALLLPQALALYQEATKTFGGAYCIEARIGLTLADEGKPAEAKEHFEKADALMPGSFGPIETYCLGCLGSMKGKERLDLARTVYLKLSRIPGKALQAYYLLAQVEYEAGNYADALKDYEEVVKRDPDYYDGWVGIVGLGEQGVVNRAKLKEAAQNLIRLDPWDASYLGNAVMYFDDYAALYRIFAATAKRAPPVPHGPLYPLHRGKPDGMERSRPWDDARAAVLDGPGRALTDSPFIRSICSYYPTLN